MKWKIWQKDQPSSDATKVKGRSKGKSKAAAADAAVKHSLGYDNLMEALSLTDKERAAMREFAYAQALRGGQLLECKDFAGIGYDTSESMKELLGTREYDKLCKLVLSDSSSYFKLDTCANGEQVLSCVMPEYMVTVRFKSGKTREDSLVECPCDHVLLGKREISEEEQKFRYACHTLMEMPHVEGMCIHEKLARILYLLLTDRLECDDLAYKLFYQKDIYESFFFEVKKIIALIFKLGLTHINVDIKEMVTAAYVKASSFDIKFLEDLLKALSNCLQIYLDDNKKLQLDKIFSICCRIINTIEAIESTDDRGKLMRLYALDQGREFAVPAITLLGCGSQSLKIQDCTSTRFYYYCPERAEFVVIKIIQTPYFTQSDNLMETDIHLSKTIEGQVLTIENAMFTDGKLKNSKFSVPNWWDGTNEERRDLIEALALPDFATLKERAYAQSQGYFDKPKATDNFFLVKVKGALKKKKKVQCSVLTLEDMTGATLNVAVLFNSSHQKELDRNGLKKGLKGMQYVLLDCSLRLGKVFPIFLGYVHDFAFDADFSFNKECRKSLNKQKMLLREVCQRKRQDKNQAQAPAQAPSQSSASASASAPAQP